MNWSVGNGALLQVRQPWTVNNYENPNLLKFEMQINLEKCVGRGVYNWGAID